MLIPLQYNADWVSSVGSLMGMGGKVNGSSTVEYIDGGRQRFIIPMYILAPLFGIMSSYACYVDVRSSFSCSVADAGQGFYCHEGH